MTTTTNNQNSLLQAATTSSSESASTLPSSSSRRFFKKISLSQQDKRATSMSNEHRRMSRSSRDDKMKYHLQVQGLLYILSFLLCIPIFIAHIYKQVTGTVPFPLLFLARTINPFQGFFNMIIYTRIPVSQLRSKFDISWIKAFSVVLRCKEDQFVSTHEKAGNGTSTFTSNRNTKHYRRSSLQIQLRHAIDKQEIDNDDDQQDEENDKVININIDRGFVSLPLQYDEGSNSGDDMKEHQHNNSFSYEQDDKYEEEFEEEKEGIINNY